MASLWDKLTGKAPFKEDVPADATENTAEKSEKTEKAEKVKVEKPAKKKKDNTDLKTCAKWVAPIIGCFVAILLMNGVMTLVNSGRKNTIATQQDDILKIKDEITIKTNEYSDLVNLDTAAKENVIDGAEDTSADDAVAAALFEKYTTWSSGDEYENLRLSAINEDGFSATSSFITTLLPAQGSYQDKDTGTWYYQVDSQNLNSKYESLKTYKLDGDGNYAAILKVSMIDKSATGMNTGKIVSIYTTYTVYNGVLSNVECALLEN